MSLVTGGLPAPLPLGPWAPSGRGLPYYPVDMTLALLLAATACAGNMRGSTPVRPVTMTPLVVTPVTGLHADLTSSLPTASMAGLHQAPLPVLTPAPGLIAASAAEPARAPVAAESAASFASPSALAASPASLQSAPADAPRPAEAEAPAEGSPSFVSRTLKVLSRIVNPFGGEKKPEPAPANEAERLDREFRRVDFWAQVAPAAAAAIRELRSKGLSKSAQREEIQRLTEAAFARAAAARGTANIGLHYNLHGGSREGYVGKGIYAGIPDDGSRDVMNRSTTRQVYFFQSARSAYEGVDASNPAILMWASRMGYLLNLFALDAPEIEAAKADGRITNHVSHSMDFHGMGGIPYSAYLAPPIEVFNGSAKKALGLGKLSREEENLATALYIEAVIKAGGAYVPR